MAAMVLALSGTLLACQTEPERDLGWTVGSRCKTPPTEPLTKPYDDFAGAWVGTPLTVEHECRLQLQFRGHELQTGMRDGTIVFTVPWWGLTPRTCDRLNVKLRAAE